MSGLQLVFRDCGGLKHLRQGWRRYYSAANLLIYVIDCSNRSRMEETGNEILQILDDVSWKKYCIELKNLFIFM
jgi:GTPase SAR1 family protein